MRVPQRNLNHCEAAHDLLMQTVRELEIDLALISELYRHLATQPWVTDTTTRAVIWSCGKCPFQSVVNCGEAYFVAAKLEGIRFYSCYTPLSLNFDEFTIFLDRLTEDARQHLPVAVVGDFNSWAVDWGSRYTEGRGGALLEAMSTIDVVLFNSGEKPTFMRGEASSIVDLTFVSSALVRGNYSWEVADIYTASNHCAILWEVSTVQMVGEACPKTNTIGWKVSNFDFDTFLVAPDVRPIDGRNAMEKNDRIATLRKECFRVRRLSQRSRKKPNSEELEAQYKSARRELNKAIKCSKRQGWKELVDGVEDDTWGRLYKVVMSRLRSQPMPSSTCPQLLEKIVSVLFPQQRELNRLSRQCEVEAIPPITEDELMEACGRVGNTKAPGPDGIPNIALKAAIKAVPALFLDAYVGGWTVELTLAEHKTEAVLITSQKKLRQSR
ncbi:uncharacterized protein LOC107045666 [Diachasma alloeum]|uniref:uncharacterized protein LOC107045666 n=1 Tax=Diachasma alloeum TaxID=454923 RepID=UPI0007382EB5|nr:uncharacterized protein LOC107045666 [Diachasma alloeum]